MHKPNYYFIMKLRLFLIAMVACFVFSSCNQDVTKIGEGTVETQNGVTFVDVDTTRYIADTYYVSTIEGYKEAKLKDGANVTVFKYSNGNIAFYEGSIGTEKVRHISSDRGVISFVCAILLSAVIITLIHKNASK